MIRLPQSAVTMTAERTGDAVGDGTADGIPGWGNDELEYYTPGGGNAAGCGIGRLQMVAGFVAGAGA